MSQYTNKQELPSLDTSPAGSIRFNTDSSKLEIYNGEQWWEIDATSPELQTGGTNQGIGGGSYGGGGTASGGTRGFIAGGYANAPVGAYQEISYYNINTTGNSIAFGDIATANAMVSTGAASRTRGMILGCGPADKNAIEFVTISSTGNAQNFGDLINAFNSYGGSSNGTRAVVAGGNDSPGSPTTVSNVIQYVTIASTGNANDYGDLAQERFNFDACSSPTRMVFGGGIYNPAPTALRTNLVDFVTISTLGDASDFGDLTRAPSHHDAGSNAIRGIFVQGLEGTPQAPTNTLDYVTIATLGNAVDFGDITYSGSSGVDYLGSAASATRGLLAGGQTPTKKADINYITIASVGDSMDFGDLLSIGRFCMGLSDVNGGLG